MKLPEIMKTDLLARASASKCHSICIGASAPLHASELSSLMYYGHSLQQALTVYRQCPTSVGIHLFARTLPASAGARHSSERFTWTTRIPQCVTRSRQLPLPRHCTAAAKGPWPSDVNPSLNDDGTPSEYTSASPALHERVLEFPARLASTLRSSALGNSKYLPMVSL